MKENDKISNQALHMKRIIRSCETRLQWLSCKRMIENFKANYPSKHIDWSWWIVVSLFNQECKLKQEGKWLTE